MTTQAPLVHNGGCDNLREVEKPTWRDRVRAEDELLEQLESQAEQARRRRARALKVGANELGSVYAVARDQRLSWTAVANAINKYTTE